MDPTAQKTDEWLAAKTTPPAVNISGIWDGGESFAGGWGEGRFNQVGRDVTGTLGLYDVKGVVSGKEVYLLLITGGRYRYTAKLTHQKDGGFQGMAREGALVDNPEVRNAVEYPIVLKRRRK